MVIVACAVLHNISLTYDQIIPEDEEPQVDEEAEQEVPLEECQLAEGFAMRQALIERLFPNQ